MAFASCTVVCYTPYAKAFSNCFYSTVKIRSVFRIRKWKRSLVRFAATVHCTEKRSC